MTGVLFFSSDRVEGPVDDKLLPDRMLLGLRLTVGEDQVTLCSILVYCKNFCRFATLLENLTENATA